MYHSLITKRVYLTNARCRAERKGERRERKGKKKGTITKSDRMEFIDRYARYDTTPPPEHTPHTDGWRILPYHAYSHLRPRLTHVASSRAPKGKYLLRTQTYPTLLYLSYLMNQSNIICNQYPFLPPFPSSLSLGSYEIPIQRKSPRSLNQSLTHIGDLPYLPYRTLNPKTNLPAKKIRMCTSS